MWRTILGAMDDIGTEQPIDVQLEFETSTRDLGSGRANFALDGRHLTWRSAPVDEFSIHGSLNDGIVELSDFKIGLDRGELTAYGEWNLADRTAELQFTSSMDFTTLAPAFPGPLGQALSRLDFPNSAPVDDRTRPFRSAAGLSRRHPGRSRLARLHLQRRRLSTVSAFRSPTMASGC